MCIEDNTVLDAVIVGAGPSGSYAGWKLSEKYPQWKINVYEASNRVGGRTWSISLPGVSAFKLELGAMRIPSPHTWTLDLIDKLELTKISFKPISHDERLFYLRGKWFTHKEVENGNVPFAITDTEKSFNGNYQALFKYWNEQISAYSTSTMDFSDGIFTDGSQFYEKGVMNAYAGVASNEALEFIKHISTIPRGNFPDNQNFASFLRELQQDADYLKGGGFEFSSIKEGMQSFAIKMMDKLISNSNSELHLSHVLKSVQFSGEVIHLKFHDLINNEIITVLSKRIILAVSSPALQRIQFDEDVASVIYANLDSVIPDTATKTFLVYDRPWWRVDGKGEIYQQLQTNSVDLSYITTDSPLGAIQELGVDETSGTYVLLIYNYQKQNLRFWKPTLKKHTEAHYFLTEADLEPTQMHIDQVNQQLATVFNLTYNDVPTPKQVFNHAWYDAPYWVSWHVQSPGCNISKLQEDMRQPVKNKKLYMVGSTFSNDHWINFAIENTHQTLKIIAI